MIADRQTHTHTDTLVTILRSPIGGGVITMALSCFFASLVFEALMT